MATVKTDQYTAIQPPAYAPNKPNEREGRVRSLFWTYTTPSGALTAGDILEIGKIPKGARVIQAAVAVPASFVTSSAKMGITGNDAIYGAAVDLSSAGVKDFCNTVATLGVETTAEATVILTFVTGNPAGSKAISGYLFYVVD